MSLAGKSALISSATRGIGLATAWMFLAAGARVAINGRSELQVAAVVAALGGSKRLAAVPGDIATADGFETVLAAALQAASTFWATVRAFSPSLPWPSPTDRSGTR